MQPNNAQKELYLTDIIAMARAANGRIGDALGVAAEGTQISNRADLAACEQALRASINARWMDAGVTLEDPATTYIGPDVTIGRDTVIGPNVIVRGATHIGAHCRFDGSALVTDAIIGDQVHIKFDVVITEAHIGDAALVGPFAQLRPGTRLGPRVHIGDFVETKNAVLGAGTEANHLAYLGDAEIGEDANIGAGTITCNYDGFRKHRTVIGDRVQVGSDSQLLAPVTIGDDAYIATATLVRKDVPAGALVFNSRDQVHRPGWVAARRAREAAATQVGKVAAAKPRRTARAEEIGEGRQRPHRTAPSAQRGVSRLLAGGPKGDAAPRHCSRGRGSIAGGAGAAALVSAAAGIAGADGRCDACVEPSADSSSARFRRAAGNDANRYAGAHSRDVYVGRQCRRGGVSAPCPLSAFIPAH